MTISRTETATMVKNRIRELRIARDMSQNDLSDLIPSKPGKTVLSLIENGHVLPTQDVLEAICDAFDCTPLDIYDENDLDLTIATRKGGDLGDPKGRMATIFIDEDAMDAIEELGYQDPAEWLRESKRRLLRERDIRQYTGHTFIKWIPPISAQSNSLK